MRDDGSLNGQMPGYRVVIVTLDSHAFGPVERVMHSLLRDYPGLNVWHLGWDFASLSWRCKPLV